MGFPAALAIVLIGIVFFASGLVVNLVQAVTFLLFRPISKALYRRINKVVAEMLWLELIWLVDWWANLKVEQSSCFCFTWIGKEHAMLLSNHRSDVDWLIGWVLAERSGCLGSSLALMKRENKWLPIIGWSMWFSDYVFLSRSWDKDESTLKLGFERLVDFPMPFWLAVFAEGTRFTQAKLEAAQEFAAAQGLPIPRNVLIPRTKGFVSAVTHLRAFVPAIYDCTVAVPKDQPSPTLLRMFRRQASVINVKIKRHPMHELPETADGISQWCKDLFIAKDAALDKFLVKDTFSERKHDIGRPKKSLCVAIVWSTLLVWSIASLFQWLSHLGSWVVIAILVTLLVIIMIGMHILIQSSESEHSTPARNVTVVCDGVQDKLIQN
ncbi:unnamed protein product [Linum tenue]|uniref:1-acylglycerol-3-phosphate O-acyltransferase n=1 Tax=Linum tenue TaxID=586396 RepID=A0AAV0MVZ8_9ROSI|nr:unnamed protein product [Linum tenue]